MFSSETQDPIVVNGKDVLKPLSLMILCEGEAPISACGCPCRRLVSSPGRRQLVVATAGGRRLQPHLTRYLLLSASVMYQMEWAAMSVFHQSPLVRNFKAHQQKLNDRIAHHRELGKQLLLTDQNFRGAIEEYKKCIAIA